MLFIMDVDNFHLQAVKLGFPQRLGISVHVIETYTENSYKHFPLGIGYKNCHRDQTIFHRYNVGDLDKKHSQVMEKYQS